MAKILLFLQRLSFALMLLFSLKIATIAVALLVDKSQLSAIGPDALKRSSSV
jgi:hypothetical protein